MNQMCVICIGSKSITLSKKESIDYIAANGYGFHEDYTAADGSKVLVFLPINGSGEKMIVRKA